MKMKTWPTTITILLSLHCGLASKLPPFSQKVFDVRLPEKPLNSSRAALTLSAEPIPTLLSEDDGRGGVYGDGVSGGDIMFSSVYAGHLNTWSLNLTSEPDKSGGLKRRPGVHKTLCFQPVNGTSGSYNNTDKFVSLVAFSNIPVTTDLRLEAEWDTDFLLTENKTVTADLEVGSSTVFQFVESSEYNSRTDEIYLLTVETESNPDMCIYVAINHPGCPWLDNPRTVQNSKLWSRMLNTSFFPIRSKDFPNSFTVALVPVIDSRECRSKGIKEANQEVKGVKVVKLRIERTDVSYLRPVVISLVAIFLSSIIFFIAWAGCWRAQLHNNKSRILDRKKYDRTFRESCERQASNKTNNTDCVHCSNRSLTDLINLELIIARDTEVKPENALRRDLCLPIEEKAGLKKKHPEKMEKTGQAVHRLMKDKLTLKDMSIAMKNAWHRRQRSKAYIYLVPLVSLFYLVPSAQMVFAEQSKARLTGSQEQCYLNYGCSRPLGIFDDFNHIVSNIGYIIYGLVFIVLVRLKSMFLPAENRTESDHLGKIGLPQQHSIFYTMGVCCVLQGVFSAIFHVCPSNISLQFDTTMMYVMLILVFIKIYQFRHPDVATNAYHCMYGFSLALLLEALSLYIFDTVGKVVFYLVFSLIYVASTLHIAVDCYYYGALKTNLMTNIPIFFRHSIRNCTSCLYPQRFILTICFVILNFVLLVFTLNRAFQEGARSLSTPILVICSVNVGMFLTYYMIRKIVEIVKNRKEGEDRKLRWTMRLFSFGFLLVAIALAVVAMMFYTRRHQSRNSTPAESRDQNELCNVMDFFDNHDMWHFFSATALFLAFTFLLTIDDDLLLEDRDQIEVF